jgi:uncharacterized protein YkwD
MSEQHQANYLVSSSRVAQATLPYQKFTHLLFKIINKERKTHGVPALWFGVKLSVCAQRHSVAMSHAGYLFHNLSLDSCVPHLTSGENIAEISTPPAQAIVIANKMMMDEGPCRSACPPGSAEWNAHGHYLNLMSTAFHRVGIGIAVSKGETWITEEFTN